MMLLKAIGGIILSVAPFTVGVLFFGLSLAGLIAGLFLWFAITYIICKVADYRA